MSTQQTASRREKASVRPPETVEKLLANAEKTLADAEQAHVMKTHERREYPKFDPSEVEVGEVLGVGGFGIVSEVTAIRLSIHNKEEEEEPAGVFAKSQGPPEEEEDHDHYSDNDHYDLDTAKEKMVRRCIRYGQARYAIKRLDPALSELDRTRGMIDMALEVKFLTVLWHPNIVKMRAICSDDMMTPHSFFIMDRLYETLEERIVAWRVAKKGTTSLFGLKKDEPARRNILLERLLVGYDIAVAFAYIHENKLVYRDIKQENLGFDVRGDVKVFDFGLAKPLLPSLKVKRSKMYNLTPITGSFPYMAPEVAMKQPYNCSCDCFSFAFLFQEIMALKNTPYHRYSPREYFQRVVKSHERPTLRRTWPKMTQTVLKEAWKYDPEKRPLMKNIAKMIREDLNQLSQEDDVINRTKHMVERSTRSMQFTMETS